MPVTFHWVMRLPTPTTHAPSTFAAALAEVHRDRLARERIVLAQAESARKRRILVPSS
jgi:hypothetical protein